MKSNLLCFISAVFALISAALLAEGFQQFYSNWNSDMKIQYRCIQSRDYYRRSGLDEQLKDYYNVAAYPKKIQRLLDTAKSDDTIGAMTVGQLLELADMSKAKCSLDEFIKRRHFIDINQRSPAIDFISMQDQSLRDNCGQFGVDKAALAAEVATATDADRAFIRDVMSKGNPKGKINLSDHQLRRATDKYLDSLPGKKKFVRDAKRLRLLFACEHERDVKELVWYYSRLMTPDWPEMCTSYHENINKEIVGENLKAAKKFANKLGDFLFTFVVCPIPMILYWNPLSFVARLVFGLIYDKFARALKHEPRNPMDPKYELFPVY